MKKIILFVAMAAVSFTSYSQALGYEDLAILFSQNDYNGSARFVAMGGAFGALGGDATSLAINPAGVAVFNTSQASVAFQSRTSNFRSNYYNSFFETQQDYLDLTSAGAVFTIDNTGSNDWSNFALGVNYRMLVDFENSFAAEGNSGISTFDSFPFDNNATPIVYDQGLNQRFFNQYNGSISELNLTFGGTFQDKLHVGAGLNFYDLTFNQFATLRELNSDSNGNTLDAEFYQENFTDGSGVNLSVGFIYKATQNFRLGLSYQTPTWFTEVIEDTNIANNDGYFGFTQIIVSEDPTNIYENFTGGFAPRQSLSYSLRNPSKFTASAAYIFGKSGLISFDYTSQDFQGLNLSARNVDYSSENQFFRSSLRRASTLNVGTEWRFDKLSLRGGYRYQQSPDANALDSDNIQAYSAGIGYNFGNLKVNLAYLNSNRTAIYNFYPQFPQVDPAELDIDNTIVTVGVSLNL